MTFTRSSNGISNYKNFLNSDIIIFSEGGNIGRIIDNPDDDVWSIDSIFWRTIFLKYLPNITVRIKSLGSKNNVLPYAEKILANEVSSSIAVMDRDFDLYNNKLISHPCVIYTQGYSWENDAWRAGILICALCELHPNGMISQKTIDEILSRYLHFSKTINRVVLFDILCSAQDLPGIPEDFGSIVEVFNGVQCRIRKDEFKKLIKKAKENKKTAFKYIGNSKINPITDCYGKLFAEFAFGVMTEFYKKITGLKVLNRQHADQLVATAISKNTAYQFDPDLCNYYEYSVKQAAAAM